MDEENLDMDAERVKKLFKQYLENKDYMIDRIIKTSPERLHTILPGLTILYMVLKYYNINKIYVSKYRVREVYLMKYVLK